MTNPILPALMAPRMTASHVAYLLEGVAFHEAGHAVAAFHLGGTLNSEGVSIDGRWYCGGRFQVPRPAPEHIVVPYMLAGDCAEFAFVGETEPSANRRQVGDALRVACPHSDLETTMAHLRNVNPDASEDELFRRYQTYLEATHAMMHDPHVTKAIALVASGLLEEGRLNAEQVMRSYLRAMKRKRHGRRIVAR